MEGDNVPRQGCRFYLLPLSPLSPFGRSPLDLSPLPPPLDFENASGFVDLAIIYAIGFKSRLKFPSFGPTTSISN